MKERKRRGKLKGMAISIVVATDRRGHIGWRGRLPWDLPADRRRFRELTMGHVVVMGRKTFESIGRPLEGRTNVVLTRRRDYTAPGCVVLHSPREVAGLYRGREVFVIGGEEVFTAFLPMVERIYLTLIYHDFPGDRTFPAIDPSIWMEEARIEGVRDEKNPYLYHFITYRRRLSRPASSGR